MGSITGIGLSGLASGLDTETMISGLMALERKPRTRLELREAAATARESALRDVLSKLRSVQSAAKELSSVSLWADTQTVASSDAAKVSARRVSGAGPGSYEVEVVELARAEQRTYSFTQSASASQIAVGSATIDLAANATLADAVAAINARSDSPVYAVDVGGKLVLSAKATGTASSFSASGSTLAEVAGTVKAGRDATVKVDGVAIAPAPGTNVVSSAVPGLELTLKAPGTVTVTVGDPAPDSSAVKAKLKAFVEQYNTTVSSIRTRLAEKKVVDADSTTEARQGVLFADTMLNGVLASMRQAISEPLAGLGTSLDELAELGVSTGAATGAAASADSLAGKLTIDETKLDAALADPTRARQLLEGFAGRLDALLAPSVQTGGTLDGRIGSTTAELDRVRDRMDDVDARLESTEKRLRAQFATLESLLSSSQSQASWLSGQIASLPSWSS